MVSFTQELKTRLQGMFVVPEMLVNRPYDAFRILVLAAIMMILGLTLSGFAILHILITGQNFNVIINLVGMVIIFILLYQLHKTKEIGLVGHFMAIFLLGFLLAFTYLNQAEGFSLVWIYFTPFAVFAMVGRRFGLSYLSGFYALLFVMTYMGIGEWNHGNWDQISYFRFVTASVLAVVLALVIDIAHNGMNKQIEKQQIVERRHLKKLQRLSTVDSLTEVYNRHYFNEVLDKLITEYKESELFLTFFILDIDHFKLYNDEFGHYQGDAALQKVAKTVYAYIKREDDFVFRLGGEEFGGLLVSDQPKETSSWVAKLKNEIEALKIPHAKDATQKYITISIGVYSAKVKDINTITCLYRIADKALYEAKNNGRNQAVIFSPEQYPRGCA
ncbi:GGDEF domain-containing protein [Thiomicrorhabdus immobilis]|uniref:diguanylate cyclase n=1 Tax=Thiomicrorhabdus immobilis TaxID=2791037 RepID=A0ABN6CZ29_9GAMM|nr:GGDEF domain-containing protein [Thiomicrorhabdus immobilis]BCN94250.1 GGDEF domain-containing protein [Thiomicrorhabdus immobilis]